MLKRICFLLFLLFFFIPLTEGFETIQLRSRDDHGIHYRSELWSAKRMALVVSKLNPDSDLQARVRDIKTNFQKTGFPIIDDDGRIEDLIKKLNDQKISKVVLLLTDLDRFAPMYRELATMQCKTILVRDLLPSSANKEIRKIEMMGCSTVVSGELLSRPSFRYKSDHRRHIAIIVSDNHYKADQWLPLLAEEWEDQYDYYCTVIHGEGTSVFHSLEELESAELLIIYIRRQALPKEQLAKVRHYIESGHTLLAIRTACHGFEDQGTVPEGHANWTAFDADILGGNYHGHGKNAIGAEISNVSELADSPILTGVKPEKWHSCGSLYFTDPVCDDVVVYQTGSSSDAKDIPVTWTRIIGQTRVAFTTLGHPEDLREPPFHQLMKNLICWALQK